MLPASILSLARIVADEARPDWERSSAAEALEERCRALRRDIDKRQVRAMRLLVKSEKPEPEA
jgi:uncharacterized membrane protein